MEQEKNNKGVIAILVAIIVILAALCTLFVTGTISLKSNNSNNNTSENNEINDTDNDTNNDENQQVNNNNTSNETDNRANENINRIIFTYSTDKDLTYDFQVTQIDQLFVIFTHAKGKQCYPNNVTIINSNGETIKKFENVDFSYANNRITIKSSNNGQCMGPDVVFNTVEYIVNGSQLIEQ